MAKKYRPVADRQKSLETAPPEAHFTLVPRPAIFDKYKN